MAKYYQQEFRQAEHPFKHEIPFDHIASKYHLFIAMDVFKSGAMGWRDRSQSTKGSHTYQTAEQFLGELMKFAPKHGTVDQHNQKHRSFWYTKQDDDGRLITMPKVRLLVELIVKRSHSSEVVSPHVLPEFELRDPKNLVGVMFTLIIHDPNVKFIDLICDLVRENARKNPIEKMKYVLEDAMPDEANRVDDNNNNNNSEAAASSSPNGCAAASGGGDDATQPVIPSSRSPAVSILPIHQSEDSNDGYGNVQSSPSRTTDSSSARGRRGRRGGGSGSQRGRKAKGRGGGGGEEGDQDGKAGKKKPEKSKKWQKKTTGSRRRPVKRNEDSVAPTAEEVIKRQECLYENIDELCKAVALFVGLCTGNRSVVDNERWLARGVLLETIRNKSDPSVDLEEAMSLSNAIAQMRKFSGQDATSVQRNTDSYMSVSSSVQNAGNNGFLYGDGLDEGDDDLMGQEEDTDGGGGGLFDGLRRDHNSVVGGPAAAATTTTTDADSESPRHQHGGRNNHGDDTDDLANGVRSLDIFRDSESTECSPSKPDQQQHEQDNDSGSTRRAKEHTFFKTAVPELTWEYKPAKASASCLTRSCFPWKNINPVLSFAYIISRCFDVPVSEVLSKANISSGMLRRLNDMVSGEPNQNAGTKDDMLSNADYIGKTIGVGSSAANGGYVDSMVGITADDELAAATGQLSVKTISHIRVLGNGCIAIKSCALMLYMSRRRKLLTASRVARTHSSKRRKSAMLLGGDPISVAGDHSSSRIRKYLERKNSNNSLVPSSAAERRTAADDKASDDIDSLSEEDIKRGLRDNKRRLLLAMHELSCCALGHLVSLSDVTATIPDSVKNCFMWLDSQPMVKLSYKPHSSNLDVFGSIMASDMMSFRQLGVAVNQFVLRVLQISRDSGYISKNSLPVHVKLMGKYASGKSVLFVLLALCSIYRSVIILTGSSAMGMLPTHAPPTKPVGDVMYLFDELLGLMTDSNSRLNSDERKVAKMLASMMTAGRVEYITTEKIDEKLVQMTKIVDATPVFGGGTNSEDKKTVIGARMLSMYVHPDVEGPRCSVHFMCDPWWPNGRGRVRAEQVAGQYKMHHGLVLGACKAIEAGALPYPDDTLFLTYLESTVEFLKHNFPDVSEHVRMVDIARPMAAVLQIETSVAMVFSPEIIGRDITAGTRFSLAMCRELLPYLRISESVTMFVIALIVHSSSDPMGYKVLRWMAEFIGNYPFISIHKRAMINIQRVARGDKVLEKGKKKTKQKHGNEDDIQSTDSTANTHSESEDRDVTEDMLLNLGPDVDGDNTADADAAAAACDGYDDDDVCILDDEVGVAAAAAADAAAAVDPNDFDEEAWFTQIKESLMMMPEAQIEMQLNRRRKYGNSRATDSALKSIRRAEVNGYSAEDIAVLKHTSETGSTVPYPLRKKEDTRRELDKAAKDLLDGTLDYPKYEYKLELAPSSENGKQRLYVNPNYIAVPGNADSFAEMYMCTHRNSKMTVADIKEVLSQVSAKQVPAHLIRLIPMDNPELIVGVEANRVRLWYTTECSMQATAPVMLQGPDRWYILVEALLSSPKHILTRVLDNLCNETTTERVVPLPMPDDRFPFILKTYNARPIPGRQLCCANPTHVSKIELDTLPSSIQDTLSSAGLGVDPPRIIKWSLETELKTVKRFFSENGFTGKAEDYTEASMAAEFCKARANCKRNLPIYPDAYIAEACTLDRKAKELMTKSDKKYRHAAETTSLSSIYGSNTAT